MRHFQWDFSRSYSYKYTSLIHRLDTLCAHSTSAYVAFYVTIIICHLSTWLSHKLFRHERTPPRSLCVVYGRLWPTQYRPHRPCSSQNVSSCVLVVQVSSFLRVPVKDFAWGKLMFFFALSNKNSIENIAYLYKYVSTMACDSKSSCCLKLTFILLERRYTKNNTI